MLVNSRDRLDASSARVCGREEDETVRPYGLAPLSEANETYVMFILVTKELETCRLAVATAYETKVARQISPWTIQRDHTQWKESYRNNLQDRRRNNDYFAEVPKLRP